MFQPDSKCNIVCYRNYRENQTKPGVCVGHEGLYHADLDIQKRLYQNETSLVNTACTDQSDEPYLIEKK